MMYCRMFLGTILLLLSVTTGIFFWADRQVATQAQSLTSARREMVRQLQLTDLAIWTEARYSRHPSQADLFTPFQEFPGALEHFPAGSLLAPPSFNLNTQLKVTLRAGGKS